MLDLDLSKIRERMYTLFCHRLWGELGAATESTIRGLGVRFSFAPPRWL